MWGVCLQIDGRVARMTLDSRWCVARVPRGGARRGEAGRDGALEAGGVRRSRVGGGDEAGAARLGSVRPQPALHGLLRQVRVHPLAALHRQVVRRLRLRTHTHTLKSVDRSFISYVTGVVSLISSFQ